MRNANLGTEAFATLLYLYKRDALEASFSGGPANGPFTVQVVEGWAYPELHAVYVRLDASDRPTAPMLVNLVFEGPYKGAIVRSCNSYDFIRHLPKGLGTWLYKRLEPCDLLAAGLIVAEVASASALACRGISE